MLYIPIPASQDEEERNELDVLRLENDTLRRNLGKLEEKVSLAEEHVHAMGVTEASQEEGSKKGGGGAFNMGQSVQLEVNQLHGILQWLQARLDRCVRRAQEILR